jgi:tRNA pseudouridine55 synthase
VLLKNKVYNDLVLNIKPGIYLVDKPSGPSSHDIVNYFRKKSGIKRVGHCGTLDPLASGLLIILVSREYTRKQTLYLKKDKEYLVEAVLGIETDSYDQTGRIVKEIPWEKLKEINKKDLQKILPEFKGQIEQTVPIFSAVKIKGQKLYQKARRGELVNLPSRLIEIKKLTLKKFQKDVSKQKINFELLVNCSSGTYIRSLIHDLGKKLGCGATVTVLRRTKIDKFSVKKANKLLLSEFKMDWDN